MSPIAWFLSGPLVGLVFGALSAWWTDRRRRRREARAAHLHRMTVRLVDQDGFEVMNVDCDHLQIIHKYGQIGSRADWCDLERIGGFRLQTRPTFQN